jgi:hypothetical protein
MPLAGTVRLALRIGLGITRRHVIVPVFSATVSETTLPSVTSVALILPPIGARISV